MLRWGPILAGLVLTTLLVTSALVMYQGLDATVALSAEGEAEALIQSVRAAVQRTQEPSPDMLATLLEEQRGAGLRYVAIWQAGLGRGQAPKAVAQAGTPAGRQHRPGMYRVAERRRLVKPVGPPGTGSPGHLRRFLRAGNRGGFGGPPGRGPGGGMGRGPGGHMGGPQGGPGPPHDPPGGMAGAGPRPRPPSPTHFIIEFEPQTAPVVETQAAWMLGVAVTIGFLIMALSIVFSRVLLQRERLMASREDQRRLATLGQMSGVMAHEIRNPLAALKGHAQLLEEMLAEDAKLGPRAGRVVSEATRLQTLINELLEFVRTGTVTRVNVDPGQLVAEATAHVEPLALDVSGAPATWPLDPARLRHAVTNIVGNAQDASTGGQPVEVSVSERRGKLVIGVRDHGPGLPDDDEARSKLFEPFHTTRSQGTGLGLAIAERAVSLHGGTITASNAPGGGALFEITLPRANTTKA